MGRRTFAWPLALVIAIGLTSPRAESAVANTDDACLSTATAGPADIPIEKRRIYACTSLLRDEVSSNRRGQLLIARAQGYVRTKSYIRGLIDLQEAASSGADPAAVSFVRASALEDMGYYALSLPEIETTARLGVSSSAVYLVRAIDKANMGRYGEAVEDADLAISADASLAPAFSVRGYAKLEIGEIDLAIGDLDRAIGLRPDFAANYYYRGRAHFALDQFDAAISDFEAAQRLAPEEYDNSGFIADVREAMSAPPVLPATEAVNAPAPPDAPSRAVGHTHNCAAYFPFLSVRLEEAGNVLIRYDVSQTGSILNVGVERSSGVDRLDRAAVICVSHHWQNVPQMKGGVPIASPYHRAIIEFRSPAHKQDIMRAMALVAIGLYGDATAAFGQVIADDPSNANLYFERGFVYYVQQDYAAAGRDFDKAVSLKADFDDAVAARELVRKAAIAAGPPEQKGI